MYSGIFRLMPETINESVSVALVSNHRIGTVIPTVVFWHGRRYQIQTVGLHHVVREGRTLIHMFSVTDGNMFFKLAFNTETLHWRLLEVEHDG